MQLFIDIILLKITKDMAVGGMLLENLSLWNYWDWKFNWEGFGNSWYELIICRENVIHLELFILLLDKQTKQKCLKTVSHHEVIVKLFVEMSGSFEKFLGIIGSKIETKGWSGYSGGFDPGM
jgi:hypothetical protein